MMPIRNKARAEQGRRSKSTKPLRAAGGTATLGLVAILVAACAGGGGSAGDGGSAPADDTFKIGMLPKLTALPAFEAASVGAKEASDELGIEFVYDGPTGADTAAQVQFIEQWAAQGFDAITVSANDPDALAPALKAAQQAGIVTTTWDSDVQVEGRQAFMTQTTEDAIAKCMVDEMARPTDGKGKFLIITSVLTASNQNAWMDAMKKYIAKSYPEMEIAAVEPGEEDLQTSQNIASSWLRANPDAAGIWGVTTVGTAAAANVVDQMGLNGDVIVTGLGTPNEMRPYVESGAAPSFCLWDFKDLGYATIYLTHALLDGTFEEQSKKGFLEAGRLGELEFIAPDRVLLGDPTVFNADNIADYDF
jgi:rhamnose transport system substrate-binding protein